MTFLRSGVGKDARFLVGIHSPQFSVKNFRDKDHPACLGFSEDGLEVKNQANFPEGDLYEPNADTIYEIPNAFPFRGTTFINSAWADIKAKNIDRIAIKSNEPCSLLQNIRKAGHDLKNVIDLLPHPLLIALAQASTDPEELVLLAKKSCRIILNEEDGSPVGIGYKKNKNKDLIPEIINHELFEVLVNNRFLPDEYKNALVLKPGVQGKNEITGEYVSEDGSTHVFEYLRRNSYIPWGHFASNMANDAVRYQAKELCRQDMTGIRHLYYQRVYARLAEQLDVQIPAKRECLTAEGLETLRRAILSKLSQSPEPGLKFDCTLWGWNYGFGYAQSGHRLHASHQMIHQQNAMIPGSVAAGRREFFPSFACGDLIAEFIGQYKHETGKNFFSAFMDAIYHNQRTDGRSEKESSLIVLEDDNVLLYVPKAQVSEWELQLIPKSPCGNILEAGPEMRKSLDNAILTAVKTLDTMGAGMVTSIEFSKRFNTGENGQHLLYSFIPRLPYAPDTFSEAQLRWISGCYPEDFACACRRTLLRIDQKGNSI